MNFKNQIAKYLTGNMTTGELPDIRKAAIEYALAIVDEIVESQKDVIDGIREIHDKALNSYDFPSENKQYCYDSIGFENAYGLFVSFDELSNADVPWQTGKTNKQLMDEIRPSSKKN
jgi:hypothetical protein